MNEKLKVYDTKMQKTMDSLDSEMGTIRAGRANPNVLNRIMVEITYHKEGDYFIPDLFLEKEETLWILQRY